jgi:hypothetical protein
MSNAIRTKFAGLIIDNLSWKYHIIQMLLNLKSAW